MSKEDCFQKRKEAARKATLLNKAYQLKTLCDVDLGLIFFPPPEGDNPTTSAEIWPSDDPLLIHQLIESYNNNKNKKSTKRKLSSGLLCSSKNRKTESPKYAVLDDLPLEKLKGIEGFLEEKISYLKARCEMLKTRVPSECFWSEEEQYDHTLALASSGYVNGQFYPFSTDDAKEEEITPTYSSYHINTCTDDDDQFGASEEYCGGFEQQGRIDQLVIGPPPAVVSIGEEDLGMTIPNCYNDNPYFYNNYYPAMLCGGSSGGGGYYSSQGTSATLMTEEGLLEGYYYSLPPPDLCY